jgi:FkbM family methyltransferase
MLIEFQQCNKLIETLHGTTVKKVFHVGAHIGEEAALYHAHGVTNVVWFEANETLLPTLDAQIRRYPMAQFIVPHPLFDENKKLKLNITNNPQSSSVFELGTHANHYPGIVVNQIKEVQAYRLDSLIEVQPPYLPWIDCDFINIDTQGAELAVLKGMGKHLRQPSLKGIYLEVNAEPLYKDIPLVTEIDGYLAENGFQRALTAWTKDGWGDAF